MLVHLHEVVILAKIHCSEIKMDRRDGIKPRGEPVNVCCSIFNEIFPIRD